MSRFCLLALALTCAASSAQSPVGPVPNAWPLDLGNRWVFQTESRESGASVRTDSRTGTLEWEVTGEVTVGAETLPVLTITATPLGSDAETWTCAVQTRDAEGTRFFDLVGADGTGECAAEPPAVPRRASGKGLADAGGGHGRSGAIVGGVTYPGRAVILVDDGDAAEERTWSVAEGIGPFEFAVGPRSGGATTADHAQLRHAEVGGETYGVPLDLGGLFVSLAPGDTWTYIARVLIGGSYTERGTVTWTAVAEGAGLGLQIERTLNEQTTLLGTCGVGFAPPATETGWALEVAITGECTGDEPFAFPLDPDTGARAFHVQQYTPGQVATVGGIRYTTDLWRWTDIDGDPSDAQIGAWEVARAIGVTSYRVREAGGDDWQMVLDAAIVGDERYGNAPVAGETAPGAPVREIRVSPNPARGAVTVAGLDGQPVALEVVDVRGRVVRRVERTTLPASVDVQGLAPGVYTVVASDGEARVTTRVVVAR